MNEKPAAISGVATEKTRKLGLSWNIYLSQDDLWMKTEIAQIAIAEKRKDSCIVRQAVEEFLDRRKKKPTKK